MVAWILAADAAIAARPSVTWGQVKRDGAAVVLATIHDVKGAERIQGEGENRRRVEGYALRLHLEEVLRGPMERGGDIEIPFSAAGYGCVWEHGDKPVEGGKAIALLRRVEGDWDLYPYHNTIEPVEKFEDPRVETWRKIIDLWNLEDPKKQLDAVSAGRFDRERGFQQFCIEVLRVVRGSWTGVDLSDVITEEMALSLIWEVFSAPGTSVEALLQCDGVFWNRFRMQDWYAHPERYTLFFDAVRRHLASGEEIQHNAFDEAIVSLCAYPEHARDTYALLLQVLGGRVRDYKFGAAIRLGLLYHPTTTDPDLEKLNRELWAKLVELLSDPDLSAAAGAAVAVTHIAMQYANVGSVPQEILEILSAKERPGVSERVIPRLASGLREVQAREALVAKSGLDRSGTEILAPPWDAHLGKRVLVAGRIEGSSPTHGASLDVDRRLLFVEGLEKWPERRFVEIVLLTGTLTKVYDLPVFRYRAGEPFGSGLPVGEGCDPKAVQRRYVLANPTWVILESN